MEARMQYFQCICSLVGYMYIFWNIKQLGINFFNYLTKCRSLVGTCMDEERLQYVPIKWEFNTNPKKDLHNLYE